MFQHREHGLNQAYQITASIVLTGVYWAYFVLLDRVLPNFALAGLANYFEYYLAIVLGFQVSLLSSRRHQDIFAVASGVLESHRVVAPQIVFSAAITCMFLVLTKDTAVSRFFLLTFIPLAYVVLVAYTRYLALPILRALVKREDQEMLLIGRPEDLVKVNPLLEKAGRFGMRAVGMLTEADAAAMPEGLPKLGEPNDLDRVLGERGIGSVFILSSPRDRRNLASWMQLAESRGCRVSLVNDLDVFLQRRLSYFRCDDIDLIELREEPLQNAVNRIVKRSLDLAISIPVVVLVLPPLMLAVWIMQRLQAPGPLIFRQERSGIDNRPFTILKFRTMYAGAGDCWRQASNGDARIYPAGRFFRRFSLDEFPQFVNVLMGEMSVVGPRPHMRTHDAMFAEAMSNYALRTFVKPGLSGLAQIRGYRGETLTREDIVRRVECDIEYVETWSLGLDIRIIWQTALQMVRPPRSAY